MTEPAPELSNVMMITTMAQREMTIPVNRVVSFREGQVTFFISRFTSLKNRFGPRFRLGVGSDDGVFGPSGVVLIDVVIRR